MTDMLSLCRKMGSLGVPVIMISETVYVIIYKTKSEIFLCLLCSKKNQITTKLSKCLIFTV